jgi:hypothetical protein
MDTFQQSGNEFWIWLKKESASSIVGKLKYRKNVFLSEKIALHDYRAENQGRGLVANENIAVTRP